MLSIKDWLKTKTNSKVQFELIDIPYAGYPGQTIKVARRIKDDIIFEHGCLVKDIKGILWVITELDKDCIHCRTSNISFKFVDGKTKTEFKSILQEINNLTKENAES